MQTIIFALLSLVIIAVMYWVIVPRWVKRYRTVHVEGLDSILEGTARRVEIKMKESSSVNAFSLPGGTILVTSALLAQSNDEILAAVAHELGHISRKHHLKGFIVTGMLISSAILALGYLGYLAGAFLILFSFLFQRFLSRRFEFEADSYATALVGRESYSNLLMKYESSGEGRSILSTHPTVWERLKKI